MKTFFRRLTCVLLGHKWKTLKARSFSSKETIDKRTVCTRCGKYYYKERYLDKEQLEKLKNETINHYSS